MFSGNKAHVSTVFFFREFQSAFRNLLGAPEALRGETTSVQLRVGDRSPEMSSSGSKTYRLSAGPGLVSSRSSSSFRCVTLSQRHCHLSTRRNVSVLSSTLKHGIPPCTTGVSVNYCPPLNTSTNTHL